MLVVLTLVPGAAHHVVGAAGENMKIDCQYVSASEAGGEIFQILMEAGKFGVGSQILYILFNHRSFIYIPGYRRVVV